MGGQQKQLHFCRSEDWKCCDQKGFLTEGDSLRLDIRNTRSAFLILPVIDSGETGFEWDRMTIKGSFTDNTAVSAYAYAWDGTGEATEFDMNATDEQIRRKLYVMAGLPVPRANDCLLHRRGRYIRLGLEFSAGGTDAPVLDEIAISTDGDHMVDYLPAIYQKDEFTRRFLSVYNSMFLDLEKKISSLPSLFDIDTEGMDNLMMLAEWLSIVGNRYADDRIREWIRNAFVNYETMFTREGILRSVKRLTGKDALIIEYFEVDPQNPDCPDSKVYESLYGNDPYTFFILLPENTFNSRDDKEFFIRNMKSLTPAGRKMELIILKKGLQLGWHSYLGVNSIVGDYTMVKIDESTALQLDTVIGGDGSDG